MATTVSGKIGTQDRIEMLELAVKAMDDALLLKQDGFYDFPSL